VAREQGPGAVVTTVFPDSNKKYLSTDLSRREPVESHYLSPRIELLEMRVIPRATIGRFELTRCDVG
jgi:cysteine synthase A